MRQPISFEDIAAFPKPGGRVPMNFQFSEDGRRVYYLFPHRGDELSLFVFDGASGTSRLVAEAPKEPGEDTFDEEMRRQRARFAWSGIGQYQWQAGTLMIPMHGHIYIQHGEDGGLTRLSGSEGIEAPQLSHNGQFIVGVLDSSLVKLDVGSGVVEYLARSPEAGITLGLAEYAAQEEFDRSEGFWISPNDEDVALTEVDERHIPRYPIVHLDASRIWTEEHRYPFVGQENAYVRLGIRSLGGDDTIRWIDWGPDERYLVDVLWTSPRDLLVLTISRHHQHLAWDRYDREGNHLGRVYEETSARWINRPGRSFSLDDGTLVTSTEREGLRRVLLVSSHGHWRTIENPPEQAVINILAVDPTHENIYVLATRRRALERTLLKISRQGGWEEITPGDGWHALAAERTGRAFVDLPSNLDHAPTARWISGDVSQALVIRDNPVSREDLGLTAPRLFAVEVEDKTVLNGLAYIPEGPAPAAGWPLVVSVYGGPHAQMVINEWSETVDLQAQWLQQHGFLVIKLDSRGSFNRGPDFEGVLFRRFGEVELADQIAGVREAGRLWPVDRTRVGIYGWSYGGYMTLRALLMAPEVFQVGVSGAPVTDFRWYDTAYTERYLGTDETNHAGYGSTDLVSKAGRLKGKLLLIHGMVDENVHFRHSAAMIQAFIDHGKDFDLVLLPNSRHMVQGQSNTLYRIRRTLEFFQEHL